MDLVKAIFLCVIFIFLGSFIAVPIIDRSKYDNEIRDMMKNEECTCNLDAAGTFVKITVYCKNQVEVIFSQYDDDERIDFRGGNQTCYPDRPAVNRDSVHYMHQYQFLDRQRGVGLVIWFTLVATFSGLMVVFAGCFFIRTRGY